MPLRFSDYTVWSTQYAHMQQRQPIRHKPVAFDSYQVDMLNKKGYEPGPKLGNKRFVQVIRILFPGTYQAGYLVTGN